MKGRKQMKALNKIYIDESRITEFGGLADAIVPDNRIETSDVCYIRKDALIKWIQEVRAIPHENAIVRDLAFQEVINKINSM